MTANRRDFLKKTALLGLAGLASSTLGKASESFKGIIEGGDDAITLPPLPYAYDALAPFIDKETMKIHHTKHHQGYIDKLNTAASKDFDRSARLEASCKMVNEKTPALVRNNLGGHYNHAMFWQLMQPAGSKADGPEGALRDAIAKDFKDFDTFKKEFSEKATKHFGSGWCWLVKEDNGKLKVTTTPNQDNPLMQVSADRGTPILGLDVWEHAYYLKYQNKRAEYIENWWNVVNWGKVGEFFSSK